MKNILVIGLLLIISTGAAAISKPFPPYPQEHLFSGYEVKNFSLAAPLTDLFNSRTGNSFTSKQYTVPGSISYLDDHNQKITISVKIRLKGHITLVNCPFPKMELELSRQQTLNTIFEGTKQIDLNTHCAEPNDSTVEQRLRYSFENHREAVIYRIMEILEMPTLKARPVIMQYFDNTPNVTPIVKSASTYQTFFLEDVSDLRKRLNAKEIRGAKSEQKSMVDPSDKEKLAQYSFTLAEETPNVDYSDIARITLFQYFVGNTDWNSQLFRQIGLEATENTEKIFTILNFLSYPIKGACFFR